MKRRCEPAARCIVWLRGVSPASPESSRRTKSSSPGSSWDVMLRSVRISVLRPDVPTMIEKVATGAHSTSPRGRPGCETSSMASVDRDRLYAAKQQAEDDLLFAVSAQAATAESGSSGFGFENIVGGATRQRP